MRSGKHEQNEIEKRLMALANSLGQLKELSADAPLHVKFSFYGEIDVLERRLQALQAWDTEATVSQQEDATQEVWGKIHDLEAALKDARLRFTDRDQKKRPDSSHCVKGCIRPE